MKRISFVITLVLSLLVTSNKSFAWGNKGHAIVAEVAFQYMDAATKKNVMSYLGDMTIEEAANWMDAIKSNHDNDYMKPWHYIDIAKGSKEMPEGDNIITVLNKTLKDLDNMQSLSKEEIKTKILILFHLIGDLHQPLHVGYPGDKGGNDVKLTIWGRNSNLHSVWDTEIIETKNMTFADILKGNTYTAEELAAKRKINVMAWGAQTRGYLKNAYDIRDTKINDFYIDANAKIIKSQLLDAGIRLAAVLEHYFQDSSIKS